MYWGMSESSTCSAAVYAALPLPPGTSLSWIPPSSLYCCQKSVSRISAAAKKRRIAASPGVRPPLASASDASPSNSAPSAAAPAPSRNERRLVPPSATLAAEPPSGEAMRLGDSVLIVDSDRSLRAFIDSSRRHHLG